MHTVFTCRNYQKTMVIFFLSTFSIIGLPQMSVPQMMPPETVDYVDVARYTGLWYQIASYFNPNIGNLAGVTAEYTINQDGTVKVVNKGFVGELRRYPGHDRRDCPGC